MMKLNLKSSKGIGSGVALLALLIVSLAPVAKAEPYIAIREGYRCSQCHVNKTGGGKRNDFANTYVQTRLAANFVQWQRQDTSEETEGVSALSDVYHGRLNQFFSVGADYRFAYSESKIEGSDTAKAMSIKSALMYFQLDMVPDYAMFYWDFDLSTKNNRELYVLFDNLWLDSYLKLGNMLLASGLRLQDDQAFTREKMGFSYGTTASGFEIGIEPGPLSVQLWSSDLFKKKGMVGQIIGRVGRVGGSYNVDGTTADTRKRLYNVFGGLHFGRFTLLGEVDDVEVKTLSTKAKTLTRAYLGELNVMLSKGSNLKFTFESLDPDKKANGDKIDRNSIVWEPFLNQFLQLRFGYRDHVGQTNNPAENENLMFMELHTIFY